MYCLLTFLILRNSFAVLVGIINLKEMKNLNYDVPIGDEISCLNLRIS